VPYKTMGLIVVLALRNITETPGNFPPHVILIPAKTAEFAMLLMDIKFASADLTGSELTVNGDLTNSSLEIADSFLANKERSASWRKLE